MLTDTPLTHLDPVAELLKQKSKTHTHTTANMEIMLVYRLIYYYINYYLIYIYIYLNIKSATHKKKFEYLL